MKKSRQRLYLVDDVDGVDRALPTALVRSPKPLVISPKPLVNPLTSPPLLLFESPEFELLDIGQFVELHAGIQKVLPVKYLCSEMQGCIIVSQWAKFKKECELLTATQKLPLDDIGVYLETWGHF